MFVLTNIPRYTHVQPPSIARAALVIVVAASPHRKTTMAQIASGVEKRRIGCLARNSSPSAWSMARPCSVAIFPTCISTKLVRAHPGQIALQVIPAPAQQTAATALGYPLLRFRALTRRLHLDRLQSV